jgi:NAD(P)-dependent dehydrogenase (short-subunit alcohol dehydrogenase family)
MGELSDRVVVVTGAARGIGQACVRGFLAAGAAVAALDRRWDGSEEFADELTATDRAVVTEADITETAAIEAAAAVVLDRFGAVDVLVNNAALRQRDLFPPDGVSSILASADADWERMLQVNLIGTLRVTRAFIRPMLAQGRGSVINVGSRGSLTRQVADGVWAGGHPGYRNQPYDASKAALASLTFYLAEEVRAHNIAVNLLFPGATNTTGSAEIVAGRRAAGIRTPDLLKPEHVVPLAVHLAQQDAATGETGLAVDALQWNRDHGRGAPAAWRAGI